MSDKGQISIAACVSENEQAAVRSAADYLARALSQADGKTWSCVCAFGTDLRALEKETGAAILITSLLPEVQPPREPWPQTTQRLTSTYAALCERGIPVFICTILRHISEDENSDAVDALRIHIRRLNLLAAEISRETGALVIDLDRVLADIGAARLETDYRLGGKAAADVTGHTMAMTLLNHALDDFVSFEIQDAARAILTASRPAVGAVKPGLTLRKSVLTMGRGRQKQRVLPVHDPVEDNYVGWLVRQVMRGAIGPGEALQRFVFAVRKRGVWKSFSLLGSGLSKQINRKK